MDIKSLISEIKNRVIIEDVIGRYVNLKKSGKNYVALCPFHHEKTPSFTVASDKGFFHCFGCGKSGDVFTFVSEIEKIPFMDAVRKIGKEVGIDIDVYLSKESSKDKSLAKKLKQLNVEAQKFFSYYLINGDKDKVGVRYLKKRGINSEVAKKFKFGMAPNSRNMLYKYLKSKFFTDETIFESKLVVNTSNGPIDLLRYRITFPIENQYGEIVGFAGRALSEEEKVKYINIPETVLFKKRNILFAFDHAR
ncbi:MAG: DNA primase, partial [Brevinematia bacterium]